MNIYTLFVFCLFYHTVLSGIISNITIKIYVHILCYTYDYFKRIASYTCNHWIRDAGFQIIETTQRFILIIVSPSGMWSVFFPLDIVQTILWIF